MDEFGSMMETVLSLFQMEFTIFGFTFSLWQVFLFDIVAGIIGFLIYHFFLGD